MNPLLQPYDDSETARELEAQDYEAETPRALRSEAASVIEMIERAAMNPHIDLDRMERLLQMRERIMAQKAEAAFAEAFAKMQPDLPIIEEKGAITNNSGKVQSTYAKWDDINEGIRPHLAFHGFALNFRINQAQDKVIIRGVLRHNAGHTDEAEITLPVDMTGSKNGVQGVGSTISYGQRYTAKLLLNLSSRKGEDDDGQASGQPESGAVQAAVNAINMVLDTAGLMAWYGNNQAFVSDMSANEQEVIVRTFNARKRKLKEEASTNG